MSMAACGLMCNECPFFGKPCEGCYKVKGKTFWAVDHVPGGTCALFACSVNTKKHDHCGRCGELPCQKFVEQKDPNMSQEEHERLLKERVARLKKAAHA